MKKNIEQKNIQLKLKIDDNNKIFKSEKALLNDEIFNIQLNTKNQHQTKIQPYTRTIYNIHNTKTNKPLNYYLILLFCRKIT